MRFFLVISFLCAALWGSGADLQFRKYSTDHGLPSNCVRDIVQTPDGFVWMATDGGIARFDGYHFKHYVLSADPNQKYDDNFAMSLCINGKDLIVGTDSHLYVYDSLYDTFRYLPIKSGTEEISNIDTRQITPGQNGDLWVCANGAGVYRINGDGEAKLYRFPQFNGFVGRVFVDSRHKVWAISNQGDGQVMCYDQKADFFRPFASLKYRALAMDEDDNHNLWLGTWNEGVVCFDPASGGVVFRTDASDRDAFYHVHTLRVMPDGLIYVGSDAGLAIIDSASGRVRHYTVDLSDPYSLSDRFIYPISLDKEGGVWIGTYYGGVNYLRPQLKEFYRYEPSNAPNSIGCSIVSDIKEDRQGDIWISSDDGGLNRYTPSSGRFSHIDLSYTDGGRRIVPTNFHSLCLDGDDLWIGSYTDGVLVYNINSGACRHFSSESDNPASLMSKSSYAIFRDRRNAMWVASGSWVNLYQRGSDDFRRVRDLKAEIIDIDEDVDGSLWFATQGAGLWRYDQAKGQWRNYSPSSLYGSLPHNHVNCVCIGSDNSVFVATAAGLCRFDRASDSFVQIDLGIPSASILSVVEDNGTLWLTSEMGLVKYPVGKGCEVFTKSDGLTSSQFVYNSILKSSSGMIYVGTRFGITAFFPYEIKSNSVVPNVVFTSLEIPNERNHGAGDHLLYDINHVDCIELHPEDYTFSISFASLSFTNPEKNQYAYKLEGFDNDWIRVGSDNKATYTNLPPGKYTFKVRASNSDNIWNDSGASLDIKVLAPWYWTWPMKLLYLLLLIGAVFFAVKAILRRKDHRHKVEITRIASDKEIEVYQAKLSFFTMIAHEIRTPVSLIIGPLEKIMRSTEKVSPAMSHDLGVIERNSQRLLFLVNQLLDFKKVEETGLSFKFRPTALKPLLMSVTERFRPSMEQRGIRLDVRFDVSEDFKADIDAEALTKLLSNLLNNASKFTKDRVSVSVSADLDNKDFKIVVADNGVGISRENQRKVFRPFYQVTDSDSPSKGGTGLGLSIVQSVVEGHGGTVTLDSAVGVGTTFVVTLPVHQSVVEAEPKAKDVADEKAENAPRTDSKTKSEADKPCLLVVDDNVELCTFIANNFCDRYEVITAPDGVEALEVLRRRQVDFVISDWMMPRLDGSQLCKAVRSDRNICHIPFILLTAKTDNISRVEGLNVGADAYVDKPFSLQVLEARVDNLLNMRALLRQKFSNSPLEPLASVAPTPADNEILTQLTAVIEENFSNPDLDIDFLAAKLDISRSGLYNKIKALIDTSPNELIRITRLKHAAKLLAQNRYRINEVCYMVGFNSTSYFAKCFQKQFGMTPTEFIAKEGGAKDGELPRTGAASSP